MKNKLIKTSLLTVLTIFTLNNVISVSAAEHKNSSAKTTKVKKTKTKKNKSKQTTPKLTGLPLDNNSSMISDGNEIKLTQNTKVNYIDVAKSKVIKTKTVKAGTTLYGFWSGQNGVNLCLYNPSAGIKITQNIWPSFTLTEDNAKVIAGYSDLYTYNATMQLLYAGSNQSTNQQANQNNNQSTQNSNANQDNSQSTQTSNTNQDNNQSTQTS